MSVRVPAGVVIDGKAWGGRFVNREQLIGLAAAVEDARGLRAIQRLAEREYQRAAAVHQRAADRFVDAPDERRRERRMSAQQIQQDWERVRDAAQDFQETTPAAPVTRTTRGSVVGGRSRAGVGGVGKPGTRKRPGQTGVRSKATQQIRPAVKAAVEWELGFKYRTTRHNRRSSDVDVNLRIRRVDGRGFGVTTARKVLDHVRRTQETPDGFLVAGVDWKRPQGGSGWRHGDVGDMEAFWPPMFARDTDASAWDIRPQDFRYGAVKRDVEDDDDG